MAHGGLRAEAIEHGAENFVVIETVDEGFIQRHFVGHGSVHHALIEIGGAQPPDLQANMMLWLSCTLER